MSRSARLLLQPATWQGYQTYLSAPLLGDAPVDHMPFLVVGEPDTAAFQPVRREGLTEGDARALIEEATANNQEDAMDWKVLQETSGFLGFFKKPAMVGLVTSPHEDLRLDVGANGPVIPGVAMKVAGVRVQDDFAAERIVDPAVVQAAAAALGGGDLLLAAPKRGSLLAVRGGLNPVVILPFARQMEESYQRAGDQGITPLVFIVQGGRLAGIHGMRDGGGYISMMSQKDMAWFPQR